MADQKLSEKLDQAREHIQDRLIQLNRDIRTEFDNLIDQLPEPTPLPAPAAPSELPKIMEAVHQLHNANNQVDLLRVLVESCGQFMPRVLLLIKKTGNLHGWSCSGFSEDFVESRLKKVRWAVDQYEELKHVVDNSSPLPCTFSELGEIAHQIEQFDGFVPFKAVFYPLVVKGKVAAVLYVDSGSETHFDRDPASLLCHLAGLELTLVALKAKGATSTMAEVPVAPKAAPAPRAATPEPEVDSSFVGRMNPQNPQGRPLPPSQPPAPKAAPAPAPAPTPSFDPYAGDFDEPAADDFAMEAEPAFEEPAYTFEPLPEEAAPVVRDDDDPNIKKAKRAARVLVSDLLLYNESAIKAARQHGDLYKRIKEDIDRSYQHYTERIADLNTQSDRNFFKEEIIRQLGHGDPNLLGPFPF